MSGGPATTVTSTASEALSAWRGAWFAYLSTTFTRMAGLPNSFATLSTRVGYAQVVVNGKPHPGGSALSPLLMRVQDVPEVEMYFHDNGSILSREVFMTYAAAVKEEVPNQEK